MSEGSFKDGKKDFEMATLGTPAGALALPATAGTQQASGIMSTDANSNAGALKGTSLAIGTSGSETSIGTEVALITGLTATGAQLNAAALAASRVRTVTTTASIDATDHGKTIFLNSATGFVTTLPAPIAGFKCAVMSKLANTSGNHTIVTSGSANIVIGQEHDTGGAAGDKGTADDTISFVANQSVAGDKVDLESDGTSWFAYAYSSVAAGMTFTQAS